MGNISAIWQQTAQTIDQLSSPSYPTTATEDKKKADPFTIENTGEFSGKVSRTDNCGTGRKITIQNKQQD